MNFANMRKCLFSNSLLLSVTPSPAPIPGELLRNAVSVPSPTESGPAFEQDPQETGCILKSEKHLLREGAVLIYNHSKCVYVVTDWKVLCKNGNSLNEDRYSLLPTQSSGPAVGP